MVNKEIINQDTKIVFTIKSFIATIGTILGIFIGFYTLVITPKFEATDNNIKDIIKKVDDGFAENSKQLMEMNNGIGIINGNIEGINNRFKDLNTIRNTNDNSGGGFGD